MDYKTITVKKEEHITILTLNRPETLNAMNEELMGEFIKALDEIERDEDVRVLVITGAGKAFCAGGDIKGGAGILRGKTEASLETKQTMRMAYGVIAKLQHMPMPTIAMVNGDAVGGGWDLALACDMRIGSEQARFSVAFTRLALIPGTGGTWLMPRIMGLSKAAEYLFTGNFLESKEAERIGVLNRVVPVEELEKETMTLAKQIAEKSPLVIREDKTLLYKGLEVDFDSALEMAASVAPLCLGSLAHKQRLAQMQEKKES